MPCYADMDFNYQNFSRYNDTSFILLIIFQNIFFYQTQIAHTENTLNDLKKENLIVLVLHLQNNREKLMEKFCKRLDTLSNTVDILSSTLDQFELSLIATRTVNDNLLNRIISLERSIHTQKLYSRRECLETVGIPTSVDDEISNRLYVAF